MVRNGATGASQIVMLPFTNPSLVPPPVNTYPQFNDRIPTAANGIFDLCANPLFYIVGDEIFNGLGISKGNLRMKDRYIKWNDPFDPFDNPDPTPELTENFEAPIVKVPGTANAGKYYCVYSDCRPFGSSVYIATYNSNNGLVTQPYEGSTPTYSSPGNQVRLAISKPVIDNFRDIYIVDIENKIVRVRINGSGQIGVATIVKAASAGIGDLSSELELSPDGKKLAWAVHVDNTAILHQYDLTTSQHLTIELAPDACQKIASLEYLLNGRLAIAATWNAPYTFLNGILVFDLAFQGANIISNSANWQDAMIELGYGNGGLLFANNGAQIIGINTATFTITSGYTITIASSYLSSPYASFPSSVSGALPDQIDGDFYVDPADCPGGDPPTNRPIPGADTELDMYFQPVIHTTYTR
ncbi:MAG: hypothetical protein SF053_01460 [Bacteroidia bacterium]|nr:hypothetical protein [Bacteroidia bacterium]